MSYVIFFGTMFLMLLIGVPIGIALAGSMVCLLLVDPVTSMTFVTQAMYTSVGNFTLLALPFFMIAGSIMATGGISKRLINVANCVVGNTTGGLGMAAIFACMLFGAISGSAPATVSAIGGIMIPQMIRAGYDKYYATGLCAVAGGLGVIVPPSYPMVVFGVTNNCSISDLFLAGWGPAILVGALLMAVNYLYSKKHGYEGTGQKFNFKYFIKELWGAKLALLMPVIILGGIYSGAFTATEAAVVAVVYGIFVGKFVYKELSFSEIWDMYKVNIPSIGGMMFVFAPAGGLTEVKKICDMAYVYDAGVQIHVCGGPIATAATLQLEAAIPNFLIHELHEGALKEEIRALCKYDHMPKDGSYEVPDLPGIGNELTEKAMQEAVRVTVE